MTSRIFSFWRAKPAWCLHAVYLKMHLLSVKHFDSQIEQKHFLYERSKGPGFLWSWLALYWLSCTTSWVWTPSCSTFTVWETGWFRIWRIRKPAFLHMQSLHAMIMYSMLAPMKKGVWLLLLHLLWIKRCTAESINRSYLSNLPRLSRKWEQVGNRRRY